MLKTMFVFFLIMISFNVNSNEWKFVGNKTKCLIEIKNDNIGTYKIQSFSGRNKPLSSVYISYLKKYNSKYMSVKSVAPVYSMNKTTEFLFSKKIFNGFNVEFYEKETSLILNELEKNNFVLFYYITNYNKDIIFKPVEEYEFKKFSEHYLKFKKCNHKLYYYNFDDIKITIIQYDEKKDIEPNLEYKKEIKKIINYLKESQKKINKIVINSYTDKKGLQSDNEYLSEKRSLYIKEFFINSGINVRFDLNNFGEKRNVNGNSTQEQRENNRRTIILIK